ncbi:hypothetical protein OPU71_05630 [Niveibacterium sp. 24ML]|uniref:hypothetical protein n=1 Tax=Niveibacterium sp. 24ML TaxID=2985512 RepID=UPI00226F2498|nr:hypothetical protein [Niveibacterium sp. 24ML]MCX9155602.1 hypothetical protein [Niveibacterium sp. 24ML]
MNHIRTAIALSFVLAFAPVTFAQGMTKTDYRTQQDKIDADYKLGKAACANMSGQQNKLCVTQAKSTRKIAEANLEASYTPTRKTHYKARFAKAEADYSVARERCNDKADNAKDVCIKEAKAAETSAKADATVQLKTADAAATSSEKTAVAKSDAQTASTDARTDATVEKRDARYAVEKEKCDALAGAAKDRCLAQAKTNFGM